MSGAGGARGGVRPTPALPGIPPGRYPERRGRLREVLGEHGLVALLVTAPADVRYLSGFTGSNGQLLVHVDATRDRLFTDGRYTTQAGAECGDLAVEVTVGAPWEQAVALAEGRLGFDPDHLSWRAAEALRRAATDAGREAVPAGGLVAELRAVKDPDEIAVLRVACRITAAAMDTLIAELTPGRTEREVARRFEELLVAHGADGPAFPTIVAAGPHGARPHHRPTDRPLGAGELVTIDGGALVAGYHADRTRTAAVGGAPPAVLAEVLELVADAQAAGIAAVRSGVAAAAVDAACRDRIRAAGYGEYFVHGTGHGVGLEIHEAPAVGERSRATLAAGMTLTVEPGVYLPEVGGVRIEDTVVVTDAGAEILTSLPT